MKSKIMQEIKGEIFYHIDTKGYFQPGKIYEIGLEYNQFFNYYNLLSPTPITFTNNVTGFADEMMKYTRERIYEDVRKEINPKLPSRESCLFLISSDDGGEYLNFWKNKAGLKGHIYQVECTGTIT